MVTILKVLSVELWKFLYAHFDSKGNSSPIKFELLESSHWRSLEEKFKLKILKRLEEGDLTSSNKAIEAAKTLPGNQLLRSVSVITVVFRTKSNHCKVERS